MWTIQRDVPGRTLQLYTGWLLIVTVSRQLQSSLTHSVAASWISQAETAWKPATRLSKQWQDLCDMLEVPGLLQFLREWDQEWIHGWEGEGGAA